VARPGKVREDARPLLVISARCGDHRRPLDGPSALTGWARRRRPRGGALADAAGEAARAELAKSKRRKMTQSVGTRVARNRRRPARPANDLRPRTPDLPATRQGRPRLAREPARTVSTQVPALPDSFGPSKQTVIPDGDVTVTSRVRKRFGCGDRRGLRNSSLEGPGLQVLTGDEAGQEASPDARVTMDHSGSPPRSCPSGLAVRPDIFELELD